MSQIVEMKVMDACLFYGNIKSPSKIMSVNLVAQFIPFTLRCVQNTMLIEKVLHQFLRHTFLFFLAHCIL